MQGYDRNARCSFSEFIRQEKNGLSRAKEWANHVRSWLNSDKIIALRFEYLVKDTYSASNKIGQNSNLSALDREPLLPEQLKNIWHSRWMRIAKQNSESTAILGYDKNQKTQKWQQAFKREDRQFFQQETDNLLIELGYEASNDWID